MSFFTRIVADAHAAPRDQAPLRIAVAPTASAAAETVANTSDDRLFWPQRGEGEVTRTFATERAAAPPPLGAVREDRHISERQRVPPAPAASLPTQQRVDTSANDVSLGAGTVNSHVASAALSSALEVDAANAPSDATLAAEGSDHTAAPGQPRTVSPGSVEIARQASAPSAGAAQAAQLSPGALQPLDHRAAVVTAAPHTFDAATSALPEQPSAAVPGHAQTSGAQIGASTATATAVAAAASVASAAANRSPSPSSPSMLSRAPSTVRIDQVEIVVDGPPERPKRPESRARPDSSASRSYRRSL